MQNIEVLLLIVNSKFNFMEILKLLCTQSLFTCFIAAFLHTLIQIYNYCTKIIEHCDIALFHEIILFYYFILGALRVKIKK